MDLRGADRPSAPGLHEAFDAALGAIDSWPVDHAAAAVVTAGGVVAIRGDAQRAFHLASLTKMLSATATLVAVEECSVTLEQVVDDRGATLRHLLCHAAGYPFEGAAPIAAPGRRRIYSNTGIELAARTVEAGTGMSFATYLHDGVVEPLGLDVELFGSPAHGARASVQGLIPFVTELLRPRLLAPATAQDMRTVQFPDLDGTVPGIGRFRPCPWGLGTEIKGAKTRHWMAPGCSPATFGHFGGAGTLCWVDPDAELALIALTDRAFGEWRDDALRSWPALGDAVLAAARERGGSAA